MKAVLKKIFLFLAATALLLYISAGTAYLTYSLHLKGSPLFYASEALEIAVFACVVPFARSGSSCGDKISLLTVLTVGSLCSCNSRRRRSSD